MIIGKEDQRSFLTERTTVEKSILFLYAVSFLALLVFLLWKCKYGFASNDEAFYLTIPYRLCLGDSLLLHEWHLSQLSGLLLYPAMKIYLAVFGSTEGIILSFRILFTIVWSMAALFFFYRLKKFSVLGAALAAIVFQIFTTFGVMALSYNSMGILLLLNAGIILATAEKRLNIQYCVAGLFLAGSILCCPYLIVVYLLLSAAAIIYGIKHRHILRHWLMFSLGCGILFVLFCLSLFQHATLQEIINVFPRLFDDPEHQPNSLIYSIRRYFWEVVYCSQISRACFVAAFVVIVLSKLTRQKGLGLIFMCLIYIAFQIGFLREEPHINFFMFPINLIAPYCALHSFRKEIQLPFWTIWVPGGIYTFCICLSSNQWFYVASGASAVMTVASIVILFCFVSSLELRADKKLISGAVITAVAALMAFQLYIGLSQRYSTVFWAGGGMRAQTVMAENGPGKGLLVTPELHEEYMTIQSDVAAIRSDPNMQKVLFLSEKTYPYLSAEKEIAAFSAWLSGVNYISVQRLDTYFSLFPDKTPDGIYIAEKDRQYVEHYLAQGYQAEQLQSGAYLLSKEG